MRKGGKMGKKTEILLSGQIPTGLAAHLLFEARLTSNYVLRLKIVLTDPLDDRGFTLTDAHA